MGGGLKNFNNSDAFCDGRHDGADLISEWSQHRDSQQQSHQFVTTKTQLQNVDTESIDYLFGVFNDDEFRYRLDIQDDPEDEQPRLMEMTKAALEVLSKNDEGFVLFVEAGHVDKAHHKGWAKKALEEVLELELAVETALNVTHEEETLIIVTADHSHSLTINGYPR